MPKKNSKKKVFLVLVCVAAMVATGWVFREHYRYSRLEEKIVASYTQGVYSSYQNTLEETIALKNAINLLLEQPNDQTLSLAREAWIHAHNAYSATEAFRFYEGPIDKDDPKNGIRSPEPRLNASPVNEAFIDYVEGNDEAGIINGDQPITKALLLEENQSDDKSNVTVGFHAIEFLLWGQDLDLEAPGKRPASDFEPGSRDHNERRREYLRTVTDILIEDLQYLVDSWKPGSKDNYAHEFMSMDRAKSLKKILLGLVTLSGDEIPLQRMEVGLKSGNEKDAPSSFSDNTHDTYRYDFQGIKSVYYANYGDVAGFGINALLEREKPELAKAIADQLDETERLIKAIPTPIDQQVLTSLPGSPGRYKMELAMHALQKLSDLFKEAGTALGLSEPAEIEAPKK